MSGHVPEAGDRTGRAAGASTADAGASAGTTDAGAAADADADAGAANGADPRAVITACPNGPLLVRGDFVIAAEPGADPERPERAVVALCRCGASSIKPLCDGTHKLIGFTTEKSGDTSRRKNTST